MLYKPRYCCNCGEKIERVDWSLLTSRRFCEICEIEFKGHELFPKVGAAAVILFGLFGTGSWWLSGKKASEVKPVPVAALISNVRNEPEIRNNTANAANYAVPLPTAAVSPSQTLAAVKNPPNISPNGAPKTSQIPAADNEAIYFCGAETKKGAPCSRRVKGGGRCWQHRGQPAILPPEKLRIQ